MSKHQNPEKTIKFKNFRFFYYMKREYLEYFLSTGYIKTTQLSHSNDPLEFLLNFTEKENNAFWKHQEPLVVCLSSRVTSSAMWGHYADSHKGICLVFDIPLKPGKSGNFDKDVYGYAIPRKISHDTAESLLFRVQYERNRVIKEFPDVTDKESPERKNFLLERYGRAVVTKAFDWEYESEYRLVLTDSSPYLVCDKGMLFYSGLKDYFKGVIIGLKSDVQDAYVRKLVQNSLFSSAFVTRASIHPQKYQMMIEGADEDYIEDTDTCDIENWKS